MDIIINGDKVSVSTESLDYDQIVRLADTKWGIKALHSITYHHRVPFEQLPGERDGIISPGRSVKVSPNMVITAVVTGSA